jgi:hypothetical protein
LGAGDWEDNDSRIARAKVCETLLLTYKKLGMVVNACHLSFVE